MVLRCEEDLDLNSEKVLRLVLLETYAYSNCLMGRDCFLGIYF